MATDFTNNNTTIDTSGGVKPKTKNTPLDMRTRVNLKADIDSIPNPFVGMKIIVLQDETNDNQMTEYIVTSLKANALGVADMKVNEVVLAKDFLGISGNGMSDEQVQQLNTAYTHSQTPHVQQSDMPTKTSQLTNDSGFITEHQDISDKADKSEIPTKTSQLQNDSGYLTSVPSEYVTETELEDKGYLTEHQDLSKYALKTEIPSVPTKTSQLTNDSGYLTSIPSEYITEEELNAKGLATETFVTNKIAEASLSGGEVDLSGYATKDELNAKANKSDIPNLDGYALKTDIPTVPTKVSDLTNDSNFISSIPSEYITETELNSKGYLTENQNISGKADKSYVDTELAKKSDKTHAHSYNDLSDKPAIPSIDGLATKKELTDGLAKKSDKTHTHDQYLTEHQDISGKANKSDIPTKTSQLTNDSDFATNASVDQKIANASTGGTVDLSSYAKKTDLPTKTSQLTNDSGYITDEITELNIMSLILGNYQIKYNSTDDTLDFLFNGTTEEPEVPPTTDDYVREGLSLYIDAQDVATQGSIRDITGKQNITNNGVSTTLDNGCLNFVASESDYIDTGLVPNLTNWSAEVYFYFTDTPGVDTQVIFGWGASGSKVRIGYSDSAGALIVQSNNESNYTIANVSDIVSPLHHLIVTMNNGALTSYFDGVKTVLCASGSTQTSHTGTLKIGCKYNGTEQFANIHLKSLRFYDGKVLTDKEALQNYNYETKINNYVTDGLSMYIDAQDVATRGSIVDISGNQTITNHGVSTTLDNGCLNFVANESDYIDTGLVPNLTTWSAEVYFYFTGTNTPATVLAWGASGSRTIVAQWTAGDLMIAINDSTANRIGSTPTSLTHLVLTYNNGTIIAYINGVKSEITASANVMASQGSNLLIGSSYSIKSFANIHLKSLRFYDGKVLSAEEVLQNYNYEINRG